MDFQYHSQYQDPSMAQRQPSESHFQHPDALSQQAQESYSNPSSLHSSPRSYPSDLDLELIYPGNPSNMGVDSNPLDDQFSAPPHPSLAYQSGYHPQGVRPKRNAHTYPGTGPLTVSTSHSAPLQEPDTENTARPGNAYKHAQFHSQSLPIRISQTQNRSEILHVQPESEHASLLGVDDDSSHMQDGMRSESPPPISDSLSSTPGVSRGLTRPLTPLEQERLAHLDRLKFFLATAPSRWDVNSAAQTSSAEALMSNQISSNQSSSPFNTSTFHSSIDQMGINPPPGHPQSAHPALNRFLLPSNEYVTCVLWGGLYHITGTDIVRALVFRFEAFGRPVQNMKKFEEGVFSDLRNLKPGVDACLEEPKSPFLDLLFKYQCIRTQKKQKVFYWFSVPHDRLFLDALERDLKREKMGLKPTTNVAGEPAMSFTYDSKKSLYEQFSKASGAREGEGELEAAVRRVDEAAGSSRSRGDDGSAEDDGQDSSMENSTGGSDQEEISSSASCPQPNGDYPGPRRPSAVHGPGSPFFAMFSLNEGSPTYKQRRKKGVRSSGLAGTGLMRKDSGEDRGRYPIRLPSCERPRYPSASQSQDGYSDADIDLDGEYGMSELSAADMFMAQAKGELADRKRMMYESRSRSLADGVGQRKRAPPHLRSLPSHTQDEVVYHNGYEGAAYPLPPLGSASSIDMNVEAMSISRSNSHEMQMNPYPTQMPSGYPAAAFPPSQDSDLLVDPHAHQSLHENNPDSNITSHDAPGSPKFACPLFSCGRSFKRMEHLKRHLRTHTQERPYQCNKCKKRFSRSDNLNQHLRTHIRIGDGGYTSSGSFDGSSASGEYDEYGLDDGADSEDFEDVEGVVNGYGNGGSTGQALGYAGVGVGSRMHGLQAQMERQTVDEGFLNAAASGIDGTVYADGQHGQDVYYSSADINPGAMLSSSSADGQWSSRPEVSPAFSNISAPSPPPGFVPHIRSGRSSLTSSPANYIRPLSASSSLYNLSNEPSSDYVTSISAPSHKQVFDHASLYPPMSIAETSGPGPIRRHRSMTPSLIRGPEGNRRPVTATGGEFPPIGQPTSAGRGYHPYLNSMGYGSANGGSGHSSPAVHPIPLERASGQQVEVHQRSTSNQMPEELAQMMHMHLEQGGDREMYTNSGVALFGEVYRSESPAPFTNALAYGKEAPVVYTTDSSAQGMAAPQNYAGDAYGGSLPWPHEQFSEPNPTAAPAYYSNLIQHQHVTI